METEEVKKNVCSKEQWYRILYMVLFAVVLYLVMMLVGVIVIVQLVFALFTGKAHDNITDFAGDLSRYIYQLVAYLTYADNRRPFPFNPWGTDLDDDVDEDDSPTAVEEVSDIAVQEKDDENKPS